MVKLYNDIMIYVQSKQGNIMVRGLVNNGSKVNQKWGYNKSNGNTS